MAIPLTISMVSTIRLQNELHIVLNDNILCIKGFRMNLINNGVAS